MSEISTVCGIGEHNKDTTIRTKEEVAVKPKKKVVKVVKKVVKKKRKK